MDDGRCPDIETHYRQRESYAMALALHDALRWPISALVVDVPLMTDHELPHAVHAWVRSPDGRGFDVSGYFEEAYFEDTMSLSLGERLIPRIETFETAADFLGFLRATCPSDQHWRLIGANLEAGRRQASRVVDSYVLRVHLAAEPSLAFN